MSNKKDKVELVSLRFSGKVNINLLNQIKEIAGEDLAISEVMRSLIMIGLKAYQNGAVTNFDGKVILNQNINVVEESHPVELKSTTSEVVQTDKAPVAKKSSFLD